MRLVSMIVLSGRLPSRSTHVTAFLVPRCNYVFCAAGLRYVTYIIILEQRAVYIARLRYVVCIMVQRWHVFCVVVLRSVIYVMVPM